MALSGFHSIVVFVIVPMCVKKTYALSFYFTDILKIDNLWEFTKLTKLQLDNNIIEKIEGLESLVNLVWLGRYLSSLQIKCFMTLKIHFLQICVH